MNAAASCRARQWKKARFKSPGDQVWFPGETVIFGIGQGYLIVTPLQAAHMVSILASRGKSYQPRLVKAYREQGTGKLQPDHAKAGRIHRRRETRGLASRDQRHDQGNEWEWRYR